MLNEYKESRCQSNGQVGNSDGLDDLDNSGEYFHCKTMSDIIILTSLADIEG